MKTKARNLQLFILSLLFILAVAACGGSAEPATEPTAVSVVEVQTIVVIATPTPEPTTEEVPVDSSSEETAVSAAAPVLEVEAPAASAGVPTLTTLTALNVRTGPGTQYRVVGSLPAGATAEIVGKSPNGHWWKIACPPGTGAECWASAGAQYTTAANASGVPVASVPPAPTHAPAATATPTAANTGNATATYTPTLNPSVSPSPTPTTDANATATYTPTPTATGNATATYTPTATTTTAVIQEAPFDNDSLQNPAQSVFLSNTGTRNFTHTNDVSYENGDQEDWVEFEFPNNSNTNQNVWLTLTCTITGDPEAQLRATIYENGSSTNKTASCNQGEVQLTVDNTKTQQVRIHFSLTKPDIYATYTLTVVGFK